MAQRVSGYERQDADFYPTPAWPVDALAEHVNLHGLEVWEPAAGEGGLAQALEAHTGRSVWRTDVRPHAGQGSTMTQSTDFLTARLPVSTIDAIITNSPWGAGGRTAVAFIERGLALMRAPGSRVRLLAFLLAVDFDSASGRTHLFAECAEFAMKVVLLRRIRWFEGPSGPSTNHAWYCWDRPAVALAGYPRVAYAPRASAAESILEGL